MREKIFLLLDAAQTSVGGASGRFPQYYSAYSELVVCAGSPIVFDSHATEWHMLIKYCRITLADSLFLLHCFILQRSFRQDIYFSKS